MLALLTNHRDLAAINGGRNISAEKNYV